MSVLEKLRRSGASRSKLKALVAKRAQDRKADTFAVLSRVIVSNYAWIPISQLGGPAHIERLKNMLTVFPRSTSKHNLEPDPIILYEETDTHLGIPRDYFARKTTGKFQVDLNLSEGFPLQFESKVKLWANQFEPVGSMVEAFQTGILGGILQAPCGMGKTVVALEIARKLGRSTLVVVHKEFLMDQWVERIREHLPDARIGTVRLDSVKFRDCDFVIAMLGSLLARRYPKEFYEYPALVISDEVHRVAAPTWHRAITQFRPKWRMGLSATPYRKDGTDNVFLWHIGPVVHRSKVQRRQPKVKRIKTGVYFPQSIDPEKLPDMTLIRILAKSNKRNGLIVGTLIKAVETGRKIIVFSDLREHLLDLQEGFRQLAPKVHNDVFVGSWFTPEWLRSNRKGKVKFRRRTKQELKLAEKAQVIWATYAMAREGLDIDTLDTCFLVTPKSDVEQTVGRILRCKKEKDPIIVDFIDDSCAKLKRQASSRMKVYKKLGAFKVTEQ